MDFIMLNQLPTADELQEEQNQLCSGLSVMEIKDWSCSTAQHQNNNS